MNTNPNEERVPFPPISISKAAFEVIEKEREGAPYSQWIEWYAMPTSDYVWSWLIGTLVPFNIGDAKCGVRCDGPRKWMAIRDDTELGVSTTFEDALKLLSEGFENYDRAGKRKPEL